MRFQTGMRFEVITRLRKVRIFLQNSVEQDMMFSLRGQFRILPTLIINFVYINVIALFPEQSYNWDRNFSSPSVQYKFREFNSFFRVEIFVQNIQKLILAHWNFNNYLLIFFVNTYEPVYGKKFNLKILYYQKVFLFFWDKYMRSNQSNNLRIITDFGYL